MGISLRTLVPTLTYLIFSPLRGLPKSIITNDISFNLADIVVIIYDICHAGKMHPAELAYSKKSIPNNTFFNRATVRVRYRYS